MYRLFFNLAQCFSFLGVIIALVKDIIGKDVLFILATIIGSLIILNNTTKIKKHY